MKQYHLYPSATLMFFTIGLYALACFSLLLFFAVTGLTVLAIMLILLLAYSEIKKYLTSRKTEPELITLRLATGEVEWKSISDSRLFTRYTVYNTRWGMVLKLKSRWVRYNLILMPDRFKNKNEYLDLRYQLSQLRQGINAS